MYNLNYNLITLNDYSYIGTRINNRTATLDYESGGVALNDATEPYIFDWKCESVTGSLLLYKLENSVWVLKFTYNINHDDFSFTFDQNMNIVISYTYNNIGYIYYFDSKTSSYIHKNIGSDIINPRVTLDDKRYELLYNSEIICCYIKNNNLYIRKQIQDYDIENLTNVTNIINLEQIGMTNSFRIGFKTF
jgi:hypothetical protein